MPTFKQGDVVRVPFPYTDRATRQHRPALVVSDGEIGNGGLLWVTMITSAENRRWEGDLEIEDLEGAGLPAPSIIRPCKIATLESRHAEPLGRIAPALVLAVRVGIARLIGLKTGDA